MLLRDSSILEKNQRNIFTHVFAVKKCHALIPQKVTKMHQLQTKSTNKGGALKYTFFNP